jgi:hypothetical protein
MVECGGMGQKPMELGRAYMGEAARTVQSVREERQRKGKEYRRMVGNVPSGSSRDQNWLTVWPTIAMNITYFRALPNPSDASWPAPTPLTSPLCSRSDKHLVHTNQKLH